MDLQQNGISPLMVFLLEKKLRHWLSAIAKQNIFWTEQASGSSIGFPDATFIYGKNACFIELKLGKGFNNGLGIEYKLRGSQKAVFRRLICLKSNTLLLVAVKGTSDIVLFRPILEDLAGVFKFLGNEGRYARFVEKDSKHLDAKSFEIYLNNIFQTPE